MRARTSLLVILALTALSLGTPGAPAQTPYSRVEMGAQISVQTATAGSTVDNDVGFGYRLTYNFSPNFALDGQFDFYPRHDPPLPSLATDFQEGGQRLAAMGGLKAGWRRQRFGLFGKVRPGIVSFSSVAPALATSPFERRTHLALDLGGVFEYYPTSRLILRFDAGEMLIRQDDRATPLSGGVIAIAPGEVVSFFQISTGLSYRLGRVSEVETRSPAKAVSRRRFEVGGQFGMLSIQGSLFQLRDEPGYGGRFTFNAYPWLSFDSILDYFYRNNHISDTQEGGSILQGWFGPKAGIRRRKMGAFLKFEPGFTSYSTTLTNEQVRTPPFPFHWQTHFAFNAGGVIEFYPSSRATVRFDVGHIQVFYGAVAVMPLLPQGSTTAPGYEKTGLSMSTGFGWRF
jgi:hypothetical protein